MIFLIQNETEMNQIDHKSHSYYTVNMKWTENIQPDQVKAH